MKNKRKRRLSRRNRIPSDSPWQPMHCRESEIPNETVAQVCMGS